MFWSFLYRALKLPEMILNRKLCLAGQYLLHSMLPASIRPIVQNSFNRFHQYRTLRITSDYSNPVFWQRAEITKTISTAETQAGYSKCMGRHIIYICKNPWINQDCGLALWDHSYEQTTLLSINWGLLACDRLYIYFIYAGFVVVFYEELIHMGAADNKVYGCCCCWLEKDDGWEEEERIWLFCLCWGDDLHRHHSVQSCRHFHDARKCWLV